MKAAIYRVDTGEIIRVVDAPPSQINIQCHAGEEFFLNPVDATHIINGLPITITPPPPPPPTMEEIKDSIIAAVQFHLDAVARSRNYDGILSLCTYATSTDPAFSAEGQAGVAWRDACWRTCYEGFAGVLAGNMPMPTPEESVAALPPMLWP